MAENKNLCNLERAQRVIAEIEDSESRQAVQLIFEGIKRFSVEQPSHLYSPFDMAYLMEVLRERVDLIRDDLNRDWGGWWGEREYPEAKAIEDSSSDLTDYGLRVLQALNYISMFDYDRRLQASLLLVHSWATWKQRPAARNRDGTQVNFSRPCDPLDYLFMVMAVHYALRPNQPARILLSGSVQSEFPGSFEGGRDNHRNE